MGVHAGDVDSRYEWLAMAPSSPDRLTMLGKETAGPAPATHLPPPYRSSSGRSTMKSAEWNGSVENRDDQLLLSTDSWQPSQPRRLGRRFNLRHWIAGYVPSTRFTWLLVSILVVQGIICIGLESWIFGWILHTFHDWLGLCNTIGTYPGCGRYFLHHDALPLVGPFVTIVFESAYQIYLGLDGVRRRNIVQVFGICLNNLSICVFTILSIFSTLEFLTYIEGNLVTGGIPASIDLSKVRGGLYTLALVPLVSMVGLCLVSCRLYNEFEWAIYRHISAADIYVRKLYLLHEIFTALLHLDFLFLLGTWVQALCTIIYLGPKGYIWCAIVGLTVTPLQLWLAGYSARQEWILGQAMAAVTLVLDIVMMLLPLPSLWQLGFGVEGPGDSTGVTWRTTGYAAVAVLLLLATMVMAVITTKHFGQGLEPILERKSIAADSDTLESQSRDGCDREGESIHRSDTLELRRMELD